MSAILAQLGGNPFNTLVGQKIEQGTDAALASENWALNMEICDIINDTDEGPKDAVKAIRKRLQQNAGKNYTVVMYSLTVLETCVKNCGRRFHLLVTQKDFVSELVKLIGPKNDPPTVVQEKVLSLIQSWADAFRNVSDMQGVLVVYNDLKQKGIEFPMTDMDAMAPIHTPQRAPHLQQSPLNHQNLSRPQAVEPGLDDHLLRDGVVQSIEVDSPSHVVPAPRVAGPVAAAVIGPIHLTPEQLAKLRSELDVVQGNMKVFGEMLTELTPGCGDHPSDLELLKDLRETCRAMQARLVQLIDRVANEEVTNELLRVNDEMNNLFIRYERFEKKSVAITGSQAPKSAVDSPTEPKKEIVQPLIDLGGDAEAENFLLGRNTNSSAEEKDNDLSSQLASLGFGGESATSRVNKLSSVTTSNSRLPASAVNPTNALEHSDEFDMFAQSRNATYEQAKVSGSTYEDNSLGNQVSTTLGTLAQSKGLITKLQKEQDFDEMEEWLMDKPTVNQQGPESISSSEFDRFLAERAAAAENLPNASAGAPEAGRRAESNSRRVERKEPESTLFAL